MSDGDDETPADDGEASETTADDGDTPETPVDDGDASETPVDDGEEESTTDDGEEESTTDDGEEESTTDDGEEESTTDDGEEESTTDDGEEESTTDDGEEESTTDDDGDGEASETTEITVDSLDERLESAESALADAETESDLDTVEGVLDDIEGDIESAELPEPDDEEEEEDPAESLTDRLSDLRDDLEAKRGPYAEDAIEEIEAAGSKIADTRWTEQGADEIADVVGAFAEATGEILDDDFGPQGDDAESLVASLDAVAEAVEAAGLDPDEDADTVAALLEATEALSTGLEDAQEWDDLETNEQLMAEGFYDVLGHFKDFPVEWSALKEWEQRSRPDMVMLALNSLQSDFMERHCLEALQRMGQAGKTEETVDAMLQRAGKRDKPAIRILGKMAAEEAVETLVEYVDADKDPQLQKVTFKALGEIGDEAATQPIADKLASDNPIIRSQAARALGLLGDTRAVDPLSDVLDDDEEDTVRTSAAWALRQIGTETALEAAAEYTGDRAYNVQMEAESAAASLEAEQPTA